MKIPVPPPDFGAELSKVLDSGRAMDVFYGSNVAALSGQYYSWDQMRYRTPPEGMSVEEWWVASKLARNASRRDLPLLDKEGRPFGYVLCDPLLELIEEVTARAS